MSVKIPFGEHEDRMYEPMEVPNGLACGCFCPACGGALIAYQRGAKRPYFGHHCATNCEGGAETALHRMAKQLLAEAEVFDVPNFHVRESATVGTATATAHARVCRAGRLIVQGRALEQANDDRTLRPDVRLWGTIEGKDVTCELWIEIAVTHAVESHKRQSMQDQGVRCIEISLNPAMPPVDRETLRDAIRGSGAFIDWLTHPRLPQKQKQAREEARQKAATKHQQAEQQAAAKAAEEQRARDAREAAHREQIEHAHLLRQRALDILANADSLHLPACTAQRCAGRMRDPFTASRTARPSGPWQVEGVEPLMLDGPNVAHIALHGPEGRLWVVLSNSAEPLSCQPRPLEGRGEAAVAIDLQEIERNTAKGRVPRYLEHRILRAVNNKRWLDHPQYKAAYEQAAAEVQARMEQHIELPPSRANRAPMPKASPEEKRRAIRRWGAMRGDPDET